MKTSAKKNYYSSELQQAKGKARKSWDIIKTLLPKKKKKMNHLILSKL